MVSGRQPTTKQDVPALAGRRLYPVALTHTGGPSRSEVLGGRAIRACNRAAGDGISLRPIRATLACYLRRYTISSV
jgi:hypothetical protein